MAVAAFMLLIISSSALTACNSDDADGLVKFLYTFAANGQATSGSWQ